MLFSPNEIQETVNMFMRQKLDIRCITMGISLMDCADSDVDRACQKIYDKIMKKAGNLVKVGQDIEKEFGVPIINKRISVTPIALVAGASNAKNYVPYIKTLDRCAHELGVGIFSPLLWSMYADVADYATETFGTSSTGLIFSSGTMAQKFGGAVSGSLIALLLGIAGATMISDEMGNESIDPASVTESVRTMIWALFSLFPAFIAVIMTFLAYIYPIKK